MTTFTLGHSNHPAAHFLHLLSLHGVTAVADVRSRPYAKYAKHFSREPLERLLKEASIAYVFLGHLVGGKPDDPALLGPEGQPDYAAIAASPGFAQGIDRLANGAASHIICLVCAEEDPSRCHRHHLIAPALAARGVGVRHIRADGLIVDDAALRAAATASLHSRPSLMD